MNPTDRAQRCYLESRREVLVASQPEVARAARDARALVDGLPKQRLCPSEIARLERRAHDAEQRSTMLLRAITAIDAELAVLLER